MQTQAATSEAKAKLDELFEGLQAIQRRIQRLRDAGEPYNSNLHDKWNAAYADFQKAYVKWQVIMPFRPERTLPQRG